MIFCRVAGAVTTIVHDGDNLLSTVAAASHGDVIEIHSNQFFSDTITWSNKYLTIRAGSGYSPSIGGVRNIRGNSQAGGEFRGLKITGTIFDSGNASTSTSLDFFDNEILGVVDLNGGGLTTKAQFIGNIIHGGIDIGTTGRTSFETSFRHNVINGLTSLGGTGQQNIKSMFTQNVMQDVRLGGTGSIFVDTQFEKNHIQGRFLAQNTGNAHYDITLRQNEFDRDVLLGGGQAQKDMSLVESNLFHGRFSAGTSSYESNYATILGNRFENSMALYFGYYAKTDFFVANNVIQTVSTTSADTGLLLDIDFFQELSITDVEIVNNTIVGYDTGVRMKCPDRKTIPNLNLSIANSLLYNKDDIDGLISSDITSSLISDGTFDSLGGNFAALPHLFPDMRLMPNSPGIDGGSNLAAASLVVDFAGNSRFHDGDGDLVVKVDVGAFEYIPEPQSMVLLLFGWFILQSTRSLSNAIPIS